MRTVRLIRIALLVALALAVSGCGAKEEAATSGGAEIVPANTPAFVSIDSNLELRPVAAGRRAASQVPDPLRGDRVSRARPSRRTRASTTSRTSSLLSATRSTSSGSTSPTTGSNVVAVTKPKDADAFRRMIEKGNETGGPDTLVFEEMDGWFVLSDTQQKLDRFQRAICVGREARRRRGLQGRARGASRRGTGPCLRAR